MRIELTKSMFEGSERDLITAGAITVSTFLYRSGVEGIRLRSTRVNLIILPFVGQQIWSATVDGVDIGMRSMVATPKRNAHFLQNFGSFLVHCGITAAGGPGAEDTHPLHGELPSAEFDCAWVEVDKTINGYSISVGGSYEFSEAFNHHYKFSASLMLLENMPTFTVDVSVENLKNSQMDLCYMAHANFRPVNGGKLEYSAPYDAKTVVVRKDVPTHLLPTAAYLKLLQDLSEDPTLHHMLTEEKAFDPEVVFKIEYLSDSDGWAHGLQVHPDGTADWISHRPDQFPHAFRWISRTLDQDCLAITEPATCGIDGYRSEKAQGRILSLPPKTTWSASMRMGRLSPVEAIDMIKMIDAITGRPSFS